MTGTSGTFDAQPFGAIAAKIAGVQLSRHTRVRLGHGDSPRSGQPVWRNSYKVGQIEDRLWKPINGGTSRGGKRWTMAVLKAAEAFELRTRAERREKEPGARNGALGPVGLAVLKYLYETVDYATGRLEPALRTIANATGHAYSAVHEALVRLRRFGFLYWMRRSKPVENPAPDGPQVEQASNAYALLIPEKMQGWLSRLIGKEPTPACEEDRLRRKREEFEAMLSGLSATEYHTDFNDKALFGPTLKSIAAAVDARDASTANPAAAMKPGDHSDP